MFGPSSGALPPPHPQAGGRLEARACSTVPLPPPILWRRAARCTKIGHQTSSHIHCCHRISGLWPRGVWPTATQLNFPHTTTTISL